MTVSGKHAIDQNSVKLTNTIAYLGASATFFMLLVLIYFFGWPVESNRWHMTGTIILYLFVPLLNRYKAHVFAKYVISITPIIFCFIISIVNKKIGPIYINDYFVYRLVLLVASIVPILIFRYNQYLHLTLSALPNFIGLLLYDKIHEWYGVGIFETGYQDDTYAMFYFTSLACYVTLVGFIYTLKRKSDVYFEDILDKNELLERRNEDLADLNAQVEARNDVISRQNKQLKDFSSELKVKVEKRTQELIKLNKELAEQNVKLEQFTFITAHNLKSPIVQIKGLLNLIGYEEGLKASTQEIVRKLSLSCMSLEEVIADLNKILNIKNSSHIVEEINLPDIVDHIFLGLNNELKNADIRIERGYGSSLPIQSIKAFVQSIFYNLIQNAVKYADHNKNDSFISVSIEDKNSHVLITIADNGIGFEHAAVKDKVFQLYQRFNTTVQGKGMGLFLVKTQLEMIKGEILVKSQVGEGTKFIIYLPKTLKDTLPKVP